MTTLRLLTCDPKKTRGRRDDRRRQAGRPLWRDACARSNSSVAHDPLQGICRTRLAGASPVAVIEGMMRGRAIPSRERMAEMGRLGRFFVNRFKGRANERLFCWIRQNLVLREGSGCLELGAGKGDMALRTDEAYRPARYVATDYDPEQVKAARRFLAGSGAAGRGRLATRFPRWDLRRGLRLRDAPSRRRKPTGFRAHRPRARTVRPRPSARRQVCVPRVRP